MSHTLLFVPGHLLTQVDHNLDPPKYELSIVAAQRLQRYETLSDATSRTDLGLCFLEEFQKLTEQFAKSQPIASIRTAPGLLDRTIDASKEPLAREQQIRNLATRDHEIASLIAQLPSLEDISRDPCHQRTADGRYPPGEHEDWFDENLAEMTDGKNMPDYDPNQEDDVYEDSEDAESSMEEADSSSSRANEAVLPALYSRLEIEKPRDAGVVYSKHSDESIINGTLFLPCSAGAPASPKKAS